MDAKLKKKLQTFILGGFCSVQFASHAASHARFSAWDASHPGKSASLRGTSHSWGRRSRSPSGWRQCGPPTPSARATRQTSFFPQHLRPVSSCAGGEDQARLGPPRSPRRGSRFARRRSARPGRRKMRAGCAHCRPGLALRRRANRDPRRGLLGGPRRADPRRRHSSILVEDVRVSNEFAESRCSWGEDVKPSGAGTSYMWISARGRLRIGQTRALPIQRFAWDARVGRSRGTLRGTPQKPSI